jgi:hypothetical protein
MQKQLAALTIVLLVGMVLVRVFQMKRQGIRAMNFGKIDKKDFLIPPFALFYFYTIFATVFGLPTVSGQEFWRSGLVAWTGVFLCLIGVLLLLLSIVSFGKSFRVGIDTNQSDTSRLPLRHHMAISPSGFARRGLSGPCTKIPLKKSRWGQLLRPNFSAGIGPRRRQPRHQNNSGPDGALSKIIYF